MKNAHFSPTTLFLQSYTAVQMHVLAQREDQGGHWEGLGYFFPQHCQIALAYGFLDSTRPKNITNYFYYYFHPVRKS